MPIIALLFSTLAFWVLYWFIRMGGIDHVQSILTRRKEEARRAAVRERERSASLRAIDDPRDAAMILMLLMARIPGDPTPTSRSRPSSSKRAPHSVSMQN